MVDIATLGIKVDSAPALTGAQNLDKLTAAAGKADAAADRLATNTGKVGPAMAGAGQNSRMFAMQLSQVAQQTSATGNFVQALAIQLPDMALGFGAVGIAAGVLASVALPTLAASLFDNAGNATALSEALEGLTTATEDFRIAAEAIRLGIDEQEVLIVEGLSRKVAELAAAEARLAANRGSQSHVNTLRAEVAEIQNQLEAYRNTRMELDKVEYAASLAADATAGIGLSAEGAVGAVQNLAGAMWDVANAAMTRINAERQLAQMAVEFSPGGQAMEEFGGRGTTSSRPVTLGDGTELTGGGIGRGGGGGGGGATNQYAAQLEALTTSLQSERDVVDAWYEEGQTILQDRRAMEILGTTAHQDAMLQLETEYQQRLLEIDQEVGNSRLALAEGIFGGLADFASAAGARGEKAARAFGAAEALINVYRAQAQVLADPKLSFFQKLPAMLAVGAAGMRVVSAIRSGGGGGGGAVGGSGTAFAAQGQQTPQAPAPQEWTIRGLDKSRRYSGEELAEIFDGLSEESMKRGVAFGVRFV
ncbi:MAG: hypothetical protein RSE12_14500 [Fuscovulum sp.]|nr:MAG: hypothetical protein RSE12_14500 [Fuscovulum sp.]